MLRNRVKVSPARNVTRWSSGKRVPTGKRVAEGPARAITRISANAVPLHKQSRTAAEARMLFFLEREGFARRVGREPLAEADKHLIAMILPQPRDRIGRGGVALLIAGIGQTYRGGKRVLD